MYLKKTPYLVKLFSNKNLIWDFKSVDKSIYLTFDDGPTPGITEKVLTILDEFNAKATFFCLGKNVKDNVKLEIDHVIPKSKGGEDIFDNFITSYNYCNEGKGDFLLKQQKKFKNKVVKSLKKR